MTELQKPEIKAGLNSFTYNFPELGLRAELTRLTIDGHGEIGFYLKNGHGDYLLHYAAINLLSTRSQSDIAKRLKPTIVDTDVDWEAVLTYISQFTIKELRKGQPVTAIGKKPTTMRLEYLLYPILEEKQPTTIFALGGSAKSLLADFIAIQVQLGIKTALMWKARQGNVLYLDWESEYTTHERRVWAIKQGLGITTEETYLYRRCCQTLQDDLPTIQKIVSENGICLVIIDSQMPAAGSSNDPAESATAFYNSLRSLECTTLTIDHVPKHNNINLDSFSPYGSVVKYNRARSVFELKKSQEPGEDSLELALKHTKHNEGKLLPPIGIKVSFNKDTNEELESITFEPCKVENNPDLAKTLTIKQLLIGALKEMGKATIKELAEAIERPESSVRAEITRSKGTFVKVDSSDNRDLWGLLTKMEV